MKRYYYSDVFIESKPIKNVEKDDKIIYLIPPGSLRYFFSHKTNNKYEYDIKVKKKCNILQIVNENDMINFFKKFVIKSKKDENRIKWSLLTTLYDALEFRWYQPYWNCNIILKNTIEDTDSWEWYANLKQPCGFIWEKNSFNMYYKLTDKIK